VAGLNLYLYADNPLMQIDPFGLTGAAPGLFYRVVGAVIAFADPKAPRFPGSMCGPAGNPKNYPASFVFGNFNSACRAHDACYDKCGQSKLWCDFKLQVDIVFSSDTGGVFGLNARGLVGAGYAAVVISQGQPVYEAAQEKACAPSCSPSESR
jgi:hypothetical protein